MKKIQFVGVYLCARTRRDFFFLIRYCFAVGYCWECFVFFYFTSHMRFTSSYSEVEPFLVRLEQFWRENRAPLTKHMTWHWTFWFTYLVQTILRADVTINPRITTITTFLLPQGAGLVQMEWTFSSTWSLITFMKMCWKLLRSVKGCWKNALTFV